MIYIHDADGLQWIQEVQSEQVLYLLFENIPLNSTPLQNGPRSNRFTH